MSLPLCCYDNQLLCWHQPEMSPDRLRAQQVFFQDFLNTWDQFPATNAAYNSYLTVYKKIIRFGINAEVFASVINHSCNCQPWSPIFWKRAAPAFEKQKSEFFFVKWAWLRTWCHRYRKSNQLSFEGQKYRGVVQVTYRKGALGDCLLHAPFTLPSTSGWWMASARVHPTTWRRGCVHKRSAAQSPNVS